MECDDFKKHDVLLQTKNKHQIWMADPEHNNCSRIDVTTVKGNKVILCDQGCPGRETGFIQIITYDANFQITMDIKSKTLHIINKMDDGKIKLFAKGGFEIDTPEQIIMRADKGIDMHSCDGTIQGTDSSTVFAKLLSPPGSEHVPLEPLPILNEKATRTDYTE